MWILYIFLKFYCSVARIFFSTGGRCHCSHVIARTK